MKKLLVYVILTLLPYYTIAQKNTHTVKLLPNNTESKVDVDFYVDRIIDNRVYREDIGIAQKGMLNRKVKAVFEKSFETELLDYLNTIFAKNGEKRAVIIRVNNLLISENTGAFKETGTALIVLDVLFEDENGYRYLGSFSSEAEKNSMDVTGKHDDRIRKVLKNCLIDFNSKVDKYESTEYLNLNKPRITIVSFSKPKEGYYLSFNDFYANTPIDDNSVSIETKSQNLIRIKNKKGKHSSYYGYFDGLNFYLNGQIYSGSKHFVKCERIENFMLFNDVFINQNKVNGMGLAFGIIGFLASNERSNTLLDLNTGRLKVIPNRKMKLLLKNDYKNFYKEYRGAPNDLGLVKNIFQTIIEEKGREYLLRLPY